MQRRHRVNRPHATLFTERLQCRQIGPLRGTGHRRQLRMTQLRGHFKTRIGKRVHRHDIAGPQQAHYRHGEAMLRAVHHQHVLRSGIQPCARQIRGDSLPVFRPPGVGLIAQQRLNIPGRSQLAQRAPQPFSLSRQRGIVKTQIQRIRCYGVLIDTQPRRQRNIPHKRAPPRFAAHQSHRLQLGIDARRRGERDMVFRRQPPVRRQLCACG